MTPWEQLQHAYPWPQKQPSPPGVWKSKGWLSIATARFLEQFIPPESTVIELGTWLGRSTRFILDVCQAARIVCVDLWDARGVEPVAIPEKDIVPHLYDLFLQRCWGYRERIVPLRADMRIGLEVCCRVGLEPDAIYVDGSHDYQSVLSDVTCSLELFPKAVLVGDDLGMEGVTPAVQEAAAKHGLRLETNEHAWAMPER